MSRDGFNFTIDCNEQKASAETAEIAVPVFDLGKEREVRQLRARVGDLEELVRSLEGSVVAGVTTAERFELQHGYKCGFHPRVIVSMETRSVTCKVCGAELEPMDVLRDFARGERQFVESLNGLSEERKRLAEEVARLKTQRSSLRSQIKKKGATPTYPKCVHKTCVGVDGNGCMHTGDVYRVHRR